MKNQLSLLFLCTAFAAILTAGCNSGQQKQNQNADQLIGPEDIVSPSAELLWKSEPDFTGSESALYFPEKDVVFVSCGNTQPAAKDGDGFIAVVKTDGTVVDMEWTTGLNAPKGMAISGGSLYVTDIDEMVEIDLETGVIKNKIAVEGAEFLNDAASDDRYVYFSDMNRNEVYRMENNTPELIAEGVTKINGLETHDEKLYGLNEDGLILFDADGGFNVIRDEVKGGDGLVVIDEETFIASLWAGQVFYIHGDKVTKIIDTKVQESNTADIWYIADQQLILVPTFMKDEIAAYQLTVD